ncbi:MAG: alpha-galactosidase [Erythrobacter sp.]|uniref:alpha-galactosidase n=1 Tax=Erythrobacter sp. TaxID=1042 RepID=UPI0025EA9F8E|nr:alpha-galactosidase [Erythrobacter sp.]MCL9999568.1 alpha-galactosidase [Erythrobacter sp.]
MDFVRLDGERLTLVFALEAGGTADCVYLGARLPEGEDLAMIAAAAARGRHENQPDVPPVPGLLPEGKAGWSGTPAVRLRQYGDHTCKECATDFRLAAWEEYPSEVILHFRDTQLDLDIEQAWRIERAEIVTTQASIWNPGNRKLALDRLSALVLPIPRRFTHFTSFAGRWAGEMREASCSIAPEGFARTSTGGKPGFGGGNWLILEDPTSGEVLGAHLSWSGDHDTRIDVDLVGSADGRAVFQMGAGWDSGAIDLAHDGSHHTPVAMIGLASDRSALAQRFHAHARTTVLPARKDWGPRKVHLNSWEALGFNLSEAGLIALAEDAAALGIERFVLDDGWFGGRRNDQTSLGDWFVSPDVFPKGLAPLIARVHDLGMDFGLWVEPEMVSPDSDLYRAHPDWCLHTQGRDRPTMRGQLALDLGRAEVRDYLFECLDALLREHAIAYFKWDHNRDLFPSAPRQTEGFYALLDHLRATHPHIEIESCSSGGGRIDYGVLQRVHRVWPSDNNDAIERLRIIPAWSQFLPLEVLGSHVGPSPNPITGRRLAMDFRAKVAVFGHMGVEADPARMTDKERKCLAAHIALYKAWRGVLHEGALHRLTHPDANITGMMVTHADKALALVAQTAFSPVFDAAPVRLAGLEPEARYRVTLPEPWPPRAKHYLANPDVWREGLVLSGTALMTQGLALPLTHPETAWLVALERLPQ